MKTNYLLILFALLLAIPQAADAKKKKDIAIQLYSVRDIINKVDNKDGKCDPTYTALLPAYYNPRFQQRDS